MMWNAISQSTVDTQWRIDGNFNIFHDTPPNQILAKGDPRITTIPTGAGIHILPSPLMDEG